MRKRDRTPHSSSHPLPPHSSSRRTRVESPSRSSSLSTLSNSIEVLGDMPGPHSSAHSSGEMGGSDPTARTSQNASEGSTQPTAVDVSVADTSLDLALEHQMDMLGIDDDFRESIRAMTPGTQREILNDIIRSHQMAQLTGDRHYATEFAGRQPNGDILESEDDSEIDEEYADNEVYEPRTGRGNHGDDMGDLEELVGAHPMTGFDFLRQLLQPGGVGGMRAVAVDADGDEVNAEAVQQHWRHLWAMPDQGGRGGGFSPLHTLVAALNNLATEAQQQEAMHRMGITQDLDEMSYEQLLELEERIGNVSKGLPPGSVPHCLTRLDTSPAEGACPICLEGWSAPEDDKTPTSTQPSVPRGEPVIELNRCHHVFHDNCIRQWLKCSKQCPVCAQDVLDDALPSTTRTP